MGLLYHILLRPWIPLHLVVTTEIPGEPVFLALSMIAEIISGGPVFSEQKHSTHFGHSLGGE